MRRALFLVAAGLLLQTIAADAQSIALQSGDKASLTMPTRINIGMNISQRIATSSIEEQRRAERAIRRRLYEMAMEAMDECMLLIDVFKAECRISSLNVSSTIQDQNQNEFPMIHGNVNGQYEIIPRR